MFSAYQEFDKQNPDLLSGNGHKLRAQFRLSDTNVTIANTIRRAIISNTPSVAFRTEPAEKSEVHISGNTTPLVNEMLALRIGLIPICANPREFDADAYEFELTKENTTADIIDVTASDFVVYKKNPDNPMQPREQVDTELFFPPDPITKQTALITRLRPRWNPNAPYEHIKLTARASVSTGKENVRWSPTSQCSYEYTMVDFASKDPAVQEYIDRVFNEWKTKNKKVKEDADEKTIEALKREFATMEIQRCYFKDEKGEPNDFTFYVESVGVQPVPAIVDAGIESLIALMETYKEVNVALPKNVRVQQGDARFPCVDLYFTGEDHTFGNLLTTYLSKHHIESYDNADSDQAAPRLSYVGYKIPHPLRNEMYIRISLHKLTADGRDGMEDNIETLENGARLAIANACEQLGAQFTAMREGWNKLTQ
jgi:DNA-directed RNA polymerase alpha subunit/DNA-directed RNA polymerase subunit L